MQVFGKMSLFFAVQAVITKDQELFEAEMSKPEVKQLVADSKVVTAKDNGSNDNYIYNYSKIGDIYLEYDGKNLVADETCWWTKEGDFLRANRCKNPVEGRSGEDGFDQRYKFSCRDGMDFVAFVRGNAPVLARFVPK